MSMTELIQLVKQYPCIYNSDVPDYARKEQTEKAWQEVSHKFNMSVLDCKEKWKNIRNGYVRSLKPSPNGIPKKPYYLCDELAFIIPYINPAINIQLDQRKKNPNDKIKENNKPTQESDESGEEKEDDVEIEVKPEVAKPKVLRNHRTKLIRKKKSTIDVDKAFVSWLQRKKSNEDDPRKMFLLSLLPDLRKLSDEQLGVFRIKVLTLLEEVKSQSGKGLQKLLERK